MGTSLKYVPRDLHSALGTRDILNKYTLAEALREWIESLSRTGEPIGVRQIADASGMSTERVSATLMGRRVPTREELDMLCLALGLRKDSREILHDIRVSEETQRAHGRRQDTRSIQRTFEPAFFQGPPEDALAGRARPRPSPLRPRSSVPAFGQPDPIRVSSTGELVQALNAVHVWAGAPSLRELERRSGSILRRSTVSDMLRGESLPDYDRYMAFLQACGVEGANLDTWVFVWRRLKALETPEVAPWMPGATAS